MAGVVFSGAFLALNIVMTIFAVASALQQVVAWVEIQQVFEREAPADARPGVA